MGNITDYADEAVLKLKNLYKEEQLKNLNQDGLIGIGNKAVPTNRYYFYQEKHNGDGLFSMVLPEYLQVMGAMAAAIKYPMGNRPEIIRTDSKGDVTFLYQRLPQTREDKMALFHTMKTGMQKQYPSFVFYDMGEVTVGEGTVPWMDYRGFCLDGSFYCLTYLLEVNTVKILGSFQCSFPIYDKWKQAVLKMISGIKTIEDKKTIQERMKRI